jgi:hypothetical protein
MVSTSSAATTRCIICSSVKSATLALLTLAPLLARAEPPHLRAVRVSEAPRFDGRLDEPFWQKLPATDAFVQKFPDEGTTPSEATTLRVAYDRDALWIGIDCPQRRSPIIARLTRRDRPIESDSVSVALDTRHNGTQAFELAVNAAGVLSDLLRFNDTDSSSDWDENWDARVSRRADGWSAELRVPLRILRFDGKQRVQSFGMQVRRYISARQETDEWAFIPRSAAGEVSRYGSLDDLRDLKPPSAFELRPFALALVRHRDAISTVLARGWDATGSAGLDLKWHLTQNLTLDATFNPDFGQVEADQVVLNLTNYEIYFPEKRPFFQEGVDVFTTILPLVYTRRVGLAPELPALRVEPPYAELLVDAPAPSRIYGAAKLVGTLGKRLTLGVMSALVARNDVEVQVGETRAARVAEPMSLFDVVRLRWQLARNTDLGLMFTASNRFEAVGRYALQPNGGAEYALCPSGALVRPGDRCFHDSYVGGPDLRWRSASGDYQLVAQAIVSGIVGGAPRRLLDGTFINAGDVGGGGAVDLSKQGGKHWLFELEYDFASQKLDYNDLGYMARQNLHHVDAILEYRTTQPWRRTVETHWRAEFFDRETFGGLNLGRGYQLNTQGKLASLWSWFAELHFRDRHYDDREVGDGTALQRERLVGLELGVYSDPRRRVYFELFTQAQIIWNGVHMETDGKLTIRALPQLDFDLLPTASYDRGEPRFAGNGLSPGEQLYGRLEASSVGATLRATYTFLPRLSLQVYAQLFFAFKHYSGFSLFRARPGELGPVVHLEDLQATTQVPSVSPDLAETVLNLNAVLRWEYRLGSTLYFVYTRAQSPDLGLMTGEHRRFDLGALKKSPAADVLLLKLTYWWG